MKTLGRTARVGDVIDAPYGRIQVENMAQVRITQVAILPTPTTASELRADWGEHSRIWQRITTLWRNPRHAQVQGC